MCVFPYLVLVTEFLKRIENAELLFLSGSCQFLLIIDFFFLVVQGVSPPPLFIVVRPLKNFFYVFPPCGKKDKKKHGTF